MEKRITDVIVSCPKCGTRNREKVLDEKIFNCKKCKIELKVEIKKHICGSEFISLYAKADDVDKFKLYL